jgi:hypothetical protein
MEDVGSILSPFGLFYGQLVYFSHLVYFSRFGILYQEKSGNPGPVRKVDG